MSPAACAGVTKYQTCNAKYSTVAAGEWFILFLFDLYILSIVLDLWPTITSSSRHVPRKAPADVQMTPAMGYPADGHPPSRTSPEPLNSHPPSAPGPYEQPNKGGFGQPRSENMPGRGANNPYESMDNYGHPHENIHGYVTRVPNSV